MRTLLLLSLFASSVFAEKPDLDTYSTSLEFAQVTGVLATQKADGSWCFGTSVRNITPMVGRCSTLTVIK